MTSNAHRKLAAMKRGQVVVTNDAELDQMLKLGDDAVYKVRSVPNPRRIGNLDVYVAWIGEPIRLVR